LGPLWKVGWLVAGAIVVTGVFAAVWITVPSSTETIKNAAAVIALVTGSSVAIERAIEALWTVLGLSGKGWFPLNIIGAHVRTILKPVNDALHPVMDKNGAFRIAVEKLEATKKSDVRKQLLQLNRSIRQLGTVVGEPQPAQLFAQAAQGAINELQQLCSTNRIAFDATEISNALTASSRDLGSFLTSFEDNPGRRMLSLYLGAIAGLGLARALRLDLFAAILQTQGSVSPLDPRWGIAVTGLVIGLGSGPTHELIQAIQQYKKQGKRPA
jgi:hypothetical protein